jgi:hypothetical protein
MTNFKEYSIELIDAITHKPLKEHSISVGPATITSTVTSDTTSESEQQENRDEQDENENKREREEDKKKHNDSMKLNAYIEVEPDLEYFIKMRNHSNERHVILEYKVDGVDLGYNVILEPRGSHVAGLWSYCNIRNQSQHKALKVQRHIFNNNDNDTRSSRKRSIRRSSCYNNSTRGQQQGCTDRDQHCDDISQIGIIEVSIYECITLEGHFYVQEDVSCTSFVADKSSMKTGTNSSTNSSTNQLRHSKNNKLSYLKSQQGTRHQNSQDTGKRTKCIMGNKLETVRVKYCSVGALIEAGVLPSSPAWDKWYHKNTVVKPEYKELFLSPYEYASSNRSKKMKISPIIFKTEVRDNNGNLISSRNNEMFDLTAL